MRKLKSISLGLFFMAGMISMSCGNKDDMSNMNDTNQTGGHKKSDSLAPCIHDCLMSLPYEDVSQEEEGHLTLMREEELMAKEVYEYLYSLYTIPVFNNISNSETSHTLTVKCLLDKYGIPDPAEGHQTGVFQNPDIQALYNSLTAQGSQSLLDALIVGITIEDLDIFDLESCMEDLDNTDISLVFSNLTKGSRNHMRAFNGHLNNQGYTYVPQYISQEYFNEIVNSPWEVGNGICSYCVTHNTAIPDSVMHE
jgi:hypothetical protein